MRKEVSQTGEACQEGEQWFKWTREGGRNCIRAIHCYRTIISSRFASPPAEFRDFIISKSAPFEKAKKIDIQIFPHVVKQGIMGERSGEGGNSIK